MQVSEGHQYDQVLFDRCIFDAYTWMKYWFKKGQLTRESMQMLQGAFLVAADRIDIAFIVLCDPAIAIRRETKNELTQQAGDSTNTDAIKFLLECNLESYEELHARFPQLVVLDSSSLNEREMVQQAADVVLETLEKKVIGAA